MIQICEIEEAVKKGKCCAVKMASKYTIALTYGEATEEQRLIFNNVVEQTKALESLLECDCECDNHHILSDDDLVLTDEGVMLSTGECGKNWCNTPGCLCEKEILALMENISLFCTQCNCN